MKLLSSCGFICIFILVSGCFTLKEKVSTPYELESAIYYATDYHDDWLNCQERAIISRRWLYVHGYNVLFCDEIKNGDKHLSVYWEKGSKAGLMFHMTGFTLVSCRQDKEVMRELAHWWKKGIN